jgi:PAS domain S-box-containing protein
MAPIGPSELKTFSDYLRQAHERFMSSAAAGAPPPLLRELDEAWAELLVAEDEMEQLCDEVIAARQDDAAQQRRYFSLFDLAPEPYLVTDPSGIVREANRAALAALQTTRARLVGKPLVVFVPSNARRRARTLIASLPKRSCVRNETLAIAPPGALTFPARVSGSSIVTPAGTTELLLTFHDATEDLHGRAELQAGRDALDAAFRRIAELEASQRVDQEALEQQRHLRETAERDDDAKNAFLAMLSHELRTPVTALVGWVHLLQHSDVDDATRVRGMQSIERSAQAQLKLVNEILDVSRIVADKLDLDARPADLVPLVKAVAAMLQPAAEQKAILVRVHDGAAEAWFMGDPERLQQVVWNLLANAIKFTPAGGRIVVAIDRTGGEVAVSVSDNGVGIAAQSLPRIFEPFRQADTSLPRHERGLGLGLTIARTIVERHGGTIRAQSDGLGTGTTVSFTLPLLDLPPVALDETTPSIVDVLIVDDDAETRALLEVALTACGIVVTSAASVAEALHAFEERPPDVVISDIGMPGEDGFSLIRALRGLPAASGGQTPAVALSGYLGPDIYDRALDAGFQALIVKPFVHEHVAGVVRALARAHRMRRPEA